MKIHFLRNATLLISSGNHRILVDPMLGPPGSLPALSFFRHAAKRNPLVPLPDNAESALKNTTAALITHCRRGHADHLDREGIRFLKTQTRPVWCSPGDTNFLRRKGLDTHPLSMSPRQPFLGGTITLVPTRHGYGWIASLMGPGVGFFIELPNEPSLYLSGDTVLTEDVRRVLTDLQPDVAVVAAGNASMDVGQPILMTLDEVLEFTTLAPGQVVANHLEALNHCPITRAQLTDAARSAGLEDKLHIPQDGDELVFE